MPPTVLKEVERVSREERRTKSELFREMFRVYQRYRKHRDAEENRWVTQIIEEAQREERERPMKIEEKLAEDEKLVRYGERQAKDLGISPRDLNRIMHASRAKMARTLRSTRDQAAGEDC